MVCWSETARHHSGFQKCTLPRTDRLDNVPTPLTPSRVVSMRAGRYAKGVRLLLLALSRTASLRRCVTIVIPVMAIILALMPSTTTAAVRRCGDFIAAAGEDRVSETAAKQKAMVAWIASAERLGPAFGAWRLALDKSLSCLKLPDGTHRCQAMARPCGVSQVPDALPPGTAPAVPSLPKREQRI
jgi:hypothetical protein